MNILDRLLTERAVLLAILSCMTLAIIMMNFMSVEVSQLVENAYLIFVGYFTGKEIKDYQSERVEKTEPELSLADKLDKLAEEVSR